MVIIMICPKCNATTTIAFLSKSAACHMCGRVWAYNHAIVTITGLVEKGIDSAKKEDQS